MNTWTSQSAPGDVGVHDAAGAGYDVDAKRLPSPGDDDLRRRLDAEQLLRGRDAPRPLVALPADAQVDENARTRSFSYDAGGVLQSVTDLEGNPSTYGHTLVLGLT